MFEQAAPDDQRVTSAHVVQLTSEQQEMLNVCADSLSISRGPFCLQEVLNVLLQAHYDEWCAPGDAQVENMVAGLEEAMRRVVEPQVRRTVEVAAPTGPIAAAMSTHEIWQRIARDYKGNQYITRVEEMPEQERPQWEEAFAVTWLNVGMVNDEGKWVLVERAARALMRQVARDG